MRQGDTHRRFVLEGGLSGEHLVDHHPQRVNIALRHSLLGEHGLLRGDVARRAEGRAQRGRPADLHRQAEVGQDGPAAGLGVEKDVGGLDVAVDDAPRVGVVQGVAHIAHDLQDALRRDGPPGAARLLDHLGQRLAPDQLHGDEEQVAGLAVLVDADDVGVIETGDGPRLQAEALNRAILTGVFRRDFHHLDRRQAAQVRIQAAIHAGDAATTQQILEDVITQPDANQGIGRG